LKRSGLKSYFLPSVVILSIIATILGIWAFWLEPASLRTIAYVATPKAWPKECDGLSIGVIADLHAGAPYIDLEKVKQVVEQTNAAQPDLILLAGDYVIQGVLGGRFIAPENAAAVLSGLRARLGIYAVLGNHDWWLDADRVTRALQKNGIKLLEDANAPLTLDDCAFTLVGISDFWEGPHDVVRAFTGIEQSSPIVAFTHNPDVFPHLPMPVGLAIAGHTHGGQVDLPLLGRLIVPSRYGKRFAAGVIVESGQTYFVGTGIGSSIIPVRFRVPPEIAIVELRSP